MNTAVAVAQEAIKQEPAPAAAAPAVVEEAPEVQELRDAELAAKAEAEAARQAGTTTAPVVEGTPAAAAPAARAPGQPEPTVPVSALYKERKARQEAERTVAQLEGAAHAYKTMAVERTTAPVAAAPAPTIDEQIADVQRQRLEAADQFDNNKLTARQLEEKRLELEATERTLRDKQRQPAPAAPVVQQDDLGLAERTAQLIKDHPVLRLTTEAQLIPLQDLVYQQAEAAGEAVPTGVLETTWLREKVAKLAETVYPNLAAQAQATWGTAAPVVDNSKPATPAPLSASAIARDAKITLAAGHPWIYPSMAAPQQV